VSVPQGPGLGVEPDMRIVEKYRQGAVVTFGRHRCLSVPRLLARKSYVRTSPSGIMPHGCSCRQPGPAALCPGGDHGEWRGEVPTTRCARTGWRAGSRSRSTLGWRNVSLSYPPFPAHGAPRATAPHREAGELARHRIVVVVDAATDRDVPIGPMEFSAAWASFLALVSGTLLA